MRHFEGRFQPWFELGRECLRHLHIDPNRVHVGHLEQLLACSVARSDQRADIGVARRDDAVERSDNGLKALHRLQLSHISLGRIGDGFLGCCIACRIVSRLLRHDLPLHQKIPTLGGDGR